MTVNGTLVEDKMRRFKGECAHFSFNKCSIYTHDGASAKFNTNSHETDNSALQSSTIPLHHMFLYRVYIQYVKWMVTTVGGKPKGHFQLENKLKMCILFLI